MKPTHLARHAAALASAWKSTVVGQAAGANLKVLRMDGSPYPDEVHAFDEALLVVEGLMKLEISGEIIDVRAGEVLIVPAHPPHAVAAGSHGTLVIIDPAAPDTPGRANASPEAAGREAGRLS